MYFTFRIATVRRQALTCQKCVWNHRWNIWIFILFSLMIDYHSLQKITTVESPVTEVCDEYSLFINCWIFMVNLFVVFFRMKWLAICRQLQKSVMYIHYVLTVEYSWFICLLFFSEWSDWLSITSYRSLWWIFIMY